MTRADPKPSLASDIRDQTVRVLARHLDDHSRLIERLELLADRRGDSAGAVRVAAKLIQATAEGARAVQRVPATNRAKAP